jgi:hypothetical protein
MSVEAEREACRALKGSVLRQEVYALDDSERSDRPYLVREASQALESVQPRGANRHSVFFTHASEAIEHHYERNPEDPRTKHDLVVAVNEFGQILRRTSTGHPCSASRAPSS